jgi:MtN3 and saliva related transmembrane protein
MTGIELLGYAAAFCTTVAFLPQAIKIIRDRDTRSLSLGMYLIFTAGLLLWLIYGLMKDDRALIFANAITLLLSVVILGLKVRCDGWRRRPGSSVEASSFQNGGNG